MPFPTPLLEPVTNAILDSSGSGISAILSSLREAAAAFSLAPFRHMLRMRRNMEADWGAGLDTFDGVIAPYHDEYHAGFPEGRDLEI
jgi:hypothetical protein